ncbi:MAG TPA: alanine--tRNA ligase [Acidimicrobiales bacterium]|nr:alanine--tRNA ligase [Acidimicrobiales bacterium]
MDSNSLRRAFVDFFAERGHTQIASSGLVPHHPTAPLFTNAGMNQMVPYFLGEEPAPWDRAVSIQKCIRTADIDIIGTTSRHGTFFEMLGNFSIGDYFKEDAIKWAWEFATQIGYDGDRIWATVHTDDDASEQIWHDVVGLPMERIQRLGDEENFWEMTKGSGIGPCGPNSEIFLDRGSEFGPDGGPAVDTAGERYLEFWNLVFIEFNGLGEGRREDLPAKNVDTGAGFERNLCLLQGIDSMFDTDVMRPIVAAAERATDKRYGHDEKVDVSLRIMADHSRAAAFLVNDGVPPSNDERGYVVRRLIRRAARHAYLLGVTKPIMPEMLEAVRESMGEAYPELEQDRERIVSTVAREEERFLESLRNGMNILEEEFGTGKVSGAVAFSLHDTFGFPIEVTEEIAGERGVEVDRPGFDQRMDEQRRRAKAGRKVVSADANDVSVYREILDQTGRTTFTGYDENASRAQVVAIIERDDDTIEIFLDRTPFYAESGGQIGDTGTITTETGTAEVLDTTAPIPGLHRHLARVTSGDVSIGQDATAALDVARRDAIRRNHTGTHLLHWALREVLGDHVKQQGSRVGPEELRFDFSHHQPMTPAEIAEVERLVNTEVLANPTVDAGEHSKSDAEQMGAIAFFGDKYGDRVRVIQAGGKSIEFCGGTHVSALGTIGITKVTSEESIGANMRRIFAVTGEGTVAWMNERDRLVQEAASLLRAAPDDLVPAVSRTLERAKALETELRTLKAASARAEGPALAGEAVNGVVVARRDGLVQDQLRDLALAVRDQPGVNAVVLGGSPEEGKVALVAVVSKAGREAGLDAGVLLADAAKAVQGGGSKNPDMSMAGGRHVAGIDEALGLARAAAGV